MKKYALAALLLSGMTSSVVAQSMEQPAEKRYFPWAAELPFCEDPAVLNHITTAFTSRETSFWNSSLSIMSYDKVKSVADRPWGGEYIPRRFCTAKAVLSDGLVRRVDYSVREDLGFAGYSYGVDFCVDGLDRHFAKAPGCRMARP
jgi:hypothetical protein